MALNTWKEQKLIQKDHLYRWLLEETLKYYKPGSDLRAFGGNQRVVRIMRYLRLLPNGDFLVQCSDSMYSIFAVLTSDCVTDYERLNKSRITEMIPRDSLILIRNTELKWLSNLQFLNGLYIGSGLIVPKGISETFAFAVISIGEIELFDLNIGESMINYPQIQTIYELVEYEKKIKPLHYDD